MYGHLKSEVAAQVNSFDKVLVDGRARASCAEYVLKFLHPDSLVFIHDYQERFFYHGVVERYYTKVRSSRRRSKGCFHDVLSSQYSWTMRAVC